jgi:hypothetical protein
MRAGGRPWRLGSLGSHQKYITDIVSARAKTFWSIGCF